jgi:regulatory protein spx
MSPKRATFLSYDDDSLCAETREFIEEAGILLDERDIKKNPLSEQEVRSIIGHYNPKHFLNVLSKSYDKHNLGEKVPPQHELAKLIAEDPTLLRRPIIQTSRLVTFGCDKKSIAQMLQIGSNNNSNNDGDGDRGPQQQERQPRKQRGNQRGSQRSDRRQRQAATR